MKNLYDLLNLPAGADSKQVSRAMLHAAEQELLSLRQLREIRDTLSTPVAKAEYDVKLFQTYPELWEKISHPELKPTLFDDSPNENDYLIFVNEQPSSAREKQIERMHTVNKSLYIISGFFGGALGLHHLLVGDRLAAVIHLVLSLTIIGLPVMFFKALFDIYRAAAHIPDEHGMIHI